MAIAHAHMHVLGIGPTRIWTILVTHIFMKLDNHKRFKPHMAFICIYNELQTYHGIDYEYNSSND